VLRGANLVRVAEDIGAKLSFHDCTVLLTRRGRAPYLVECVAQIVAASLTQKTAVPRFTVVFYGLRIFCRKAAQFRAAC
jgi:hypothetical protein